MDAEVGIIGVGTMGSMAMWQLARKGVSVIGFEQFGIGHDRSAAGGETRIFRTAYKEGAEYVPILQEAYKQWRQLEEETGSKLLTLNGGHIIGDPSLRSMKNVMQSIKEYNLEHKILNYEEAKRKFPQHQLLPNEIMLEDKQAGYLRPQYAVVSAVDRAEALGAIVERHTKVEEIKPDNNGVVILANNREYRVGKIIVTTGPWIYDLFPELKVHIEVRRLINTWFSSRYMEQFVADRFPVFTRESKEFSYYGIPTVDGTMVKIAQASTTNDQIAEPDNMKRNVEPKEILSIRRVIEKYLPGLFPDPVRVNAYMEAYTTDKHPIVGNLPENNNIIITSGFSGHGFKMAPAIGKIAADIALNEKGQFNIEKFNPNRFIKTDQATTDV